MRPRSLAALVLTGAAGIAPLHPVRAQDAAEEQPAVAIAVDGALEEASDPELESAHELDRLAARVAGLDAFALTLSMDTEALGRGTVELLYDGPGRARLVWELGGQVSTGWYLDGVLQLTNSAGDARNHARYDATEFVRQVPSVHAVLVQEFPEAWPVADLGPGPVFHVHPNLSGEDEGSALLITLSFARARTSLFCWSSEHRRRFGAVTLESDALVFGDRGEVFFELSREHGFPIGGHARGGRGAVTLALAELDTSPEFAADVFEVPAPAPGSQDVSEAAGALARDPYTPENQRIEAYAALLGLLERGVIRWNDAPEERIGRVFEELNRLFLPSRFEDLIASSDEQAMEEVARIFRAHGNHPLEDRRGEVEAVREQIKEAMDVVRERYVAPLEVAPILDPPGVAADVERLRVLEVRAARAMFDVTVAQRILDNYHARSRALLYER